MTTTPTFQPPVANDEFDDDDVDSEDWADDHTTPGRAAPHRLSPHFFRRDDDGTVRLRLKLSPEEAAMIEEAAGETPLILYIHRVLKERAKFHIRKNQETARARRS